MLVTWLIISVFKGPRAGVVDGAAAAAEDVHSVVSTIVGAGTVVSVGASMEVDAASHVWIWIVLPLESISMSWMTETVDVTEATVVSI